MTKYKKGADFERRVKKLLENDGYLCVRSAGSKGAADLIAINPFNKTVLLIQCKLKGSISKKERGVLISVAKDFGCVPIIGYIAGKDVVLEVVIR